MNEVLTFDEMRRRFIDEYVLVSDPETDNGPDILGGLVLYHAKDREEVLDKCIEIRPKFYAVVYTGELDPDMEFAL